MTDATTPLQSPQLEEEIRAYVERLHERSNRVLGGQVVPAAKRARVTAWFLRELRSQDGVDAAREVVQALVDPAEVVTVDFWRTTLGRTVAWHVGYFDDVVPAAVAAAILDMSRQAVHDAKQRGTLAAVRVDGIPQAGVGRDSVRAYLRAQHGVRA